MAPAGAQYRASTSAPQPAPKGSHLVPHLLTGPQDAPHQGVDCSITRQAVHAPAVLQGLQGGVI